MLAVLETHPVSRAVYRAQFGIPVTAIYGSDFSVVGYRDREFGATLGWDTDLLSGYDAVFLSRSGSDGAKTPERVSVRGMGQALAAACCPACNPRRVELLVNEALHHGVPCVVSEAVRRAPDLVEPGVTGEISETGSSRSLTAAPLRW
jgi:hypothetical protein